MRLAGKRVIITGTGDGQGRAAALRFTAEGARVVGCDLNATSAAETEATVRGAGGDFVTVAPLDLTAEADVETLVETAVEHLGGLDGVYNNAAGARLGPPCRCPRRMLISPCTACSAFRGSSRAERSRTSRNPTRRPS